MIWVLLSVALTIWAARIIYTYDDPQWDALYRRMYNNKGDKT